VKPLTSANITVTTLRAGSAAAAPGSAAPQAEQNRAVSPAGAAHLGHAAMARV